MPPKKERTPDLARRILAVAIDVLADEGVPGVTTREVAARAGTTAPAIYELFSDKSGLVRAMFFEGFRRLGVVFSRLAEPAGRPDDLGNALRAFREFTLENPRLFEVMYNRPFADFTPDAQEQALGDTTREALMARARACVEAGTLAGNPADIAHAVMALAIGLATQETAGWLGPDGRTRSRRWNVAIAALIDGFKPTAGGG